MFFFLSEGVGRLYAQFTDNAPRQAEACREAGEGNLVPQLRFQVHQLQQLAPLILGPVLCQLLVELIEFLPQFRELRLLEELLVQSSHVFVHQIASCQRHTIPQLRSNSYVSGQVLSESYQFSVYFQINRGNLDTLLP